jgi:hypothetical protein
MCDSFDWSVLLLCRNFMLGKSKSVIVIQCYESTHVHAILLLKKGAKLKSHMHSKLTCFHIALGKV